MNKDFTLLNKIELSLVEPPSSFLDLKSKLHLEIERKWSLEQGKSSKVFNGCLFSVKNFNIDEVKNKHVLEIFEADYKSFLVQQSGIDLGIRPLGVTGVISKEIEGTEKLLMAERSMDNSTYGGFWEFVPSGGLDFFESYPAEDFVARQLLVELEEELGVPKEFVENYELLALSFDSAIKVFDLIYLLKISQNLNLQLSAEHKKYLFLSNEEFVADYVGKSLPNCKNVFESLRKTESGK